MKHMRIIPPLLTALILGSTSSAQANIDDWEALKTIPLGTKIKVALRYQRTFGHCKLQDVTDDWLACDFSVLGYRRYARAEIRKISLGHHSARTGFLIGAGTGAILGATNGTADRAGRVFYAIILTPVVGGIGAGIGAIVDPFLHGKTIYRSQDSRAAKDSAKTPLANEAALNEITRSEVRP